MNNEGNQQAAKNIFWRVYNLPTFSLLSFSLSAVQKFNIRDENNRKINISNSDDRRYYLIPDKFKNNNEYKKYFEKYQMIGNGNVNPANPESVDEF